MTTYYVIDGDIFNDYGVDICDWFAEVDYFFDSNTYAVNAKLDEIKRMPESDLRLLQRYTIMKFDDLHIPHRKVQ